MLEIYLTNQSSSTTHLAPAQIPTRGQQRAGNNSIMFAYESALRM